MQRKRLALVLAMVIAFTFVVGLSGLALANTPFSGGTLTVIRDGGNTIYRYVPPSGGEQSSGGTRITYHRSGNLVYRIVIRVPGSSAQPSQPAPQPQPPAQQPDPPAQPAPPAEQPDPPAQPAPPAQQPDPPASQPAPPAQQPDPPASQPDPPAQPVDPQPPANGFLTADEALMLSLVNRERARAGVAPLEAHPGLTRLARLKSQDMITHNYFAHQSPTYGSPFDMIRGAGISYRTAGENLAGAPTVERAHQGLMNSPGHRRNILNPSFTHVGIGIIRGGSYGMMFTQMFIGVN